MPHPAQQLSIGYHSFSAECRTNTFSGHLGSKICSQSAFLAYLHSLHCPGLPAPHHNRTRLLSISQRSSTFCTTVPLLCVLSFWNFLLPLSFSPNIHMLTFKYPLRLSSGYTSFLDWSKVIFLLQHSIFTIKSVITLFYVQNMNIHIYPINFLSRYTTNKQRKRIVNYVIWTGFKI